MQNYSFIAVMIAISLLTAWSYYRTKNYKKELVESFKELDFQSANKWEIDQTIVPLFFKKKAKILLQGEHRLRQIVVAYFESSGSNGDSENIVISVALESAYDWPRTTIVPDSSLQRLKKLKRNRVRTDDPAIDKHWIILSEDERTVREIVDAMYETLHRKPKVIKSFRLASNDDRDHETRFEFDAQWVVITQRVDSYHIEDAIERLDWIELQVQRLEDNMVLAENRVTKDDEA